jgi:hypothetical protein
MSCAWTFRDGELRFAWPERGLISVNSGSPYHWLLIRRGLLICASNLTHLSILDPICESGSIVTRDLSSLVTASVILTSHQLHSSRVPMVDGYRLLDGLSHATTLELHAPLRYTRYEWSLSHTRNPHAVSYRHFVFIDGVRSNPVSFKFWNSAPFFQSTPPIFPVSREAQHAYEKVKEE